MNPQNTESQNPPLELSSYAAVIGIDWADQKHALATLALPLENQAPELSTLEQKTEALLALPYSIDDPEANRDYKPG